MIVLASASPRRQELLSLITENYKIEPAHIDESIHEQIDLYKIPEHLAFKKAEYVHKLHPDDTVIGCDTGVFVDNQMIGKPKSDKAKCYVKAFAGYAYYSKERTVNQTLEDASYHGNALEFGLGVETEINRMVRGGSVEFCVAYSPKTKFEHDVMVLGGHEPSHTIYERDSRWTFSVGLVKRFGKGKICPLVRAGGFYTLHYGNHESRYYMSKKIVDTEWDNTAFFGAYLGAGAQMAMGRHFVRLHGDWYKSLAISNTGNMMKLGITAEFGL